MSVSNANKVLSTDHISCGDSFTVTLSFTAAPDCECTRLTGDKCRAGATNIVIRDVVDPCFRILSARLPNHGTASLIDSQTVEWTIECLGDTEEETASLEFEVEHIGSCTGLVEVNSSVSYSDAEGHELEFPSPEIEIDCQVVTEAEACPVPRDLYIDSCDDVVELDAGDLYLGSLGRIMQLDVTLKNVCPGKAVALGVILSEVDEEGNEYRRGLKTLTIPAHDKSGCRDVLVRCIKFVLPEDTAPVSAPETLCSNRHFVARLISHYIDNDYSCCTDEAAE